jgi:hypothetical protein
MNRQRLGFLSLLGLSVLVSASGFWVGPGRWIFYAGPNDVPNSQVIALCDWIGITWIVVFFLSVAMHPTKAILFLIPAPFVLYWPIMFAIRGVFVLRA